MGAGPHGNVITMQEAALLVARIREYPRYPDPYHLEPMRVALEFGLAQRTLYLSVYGLPLSPLEIPFEDLLPKPIKLGLCCSIVLVQILRNREGQETILAAAAVALQRVLFALPAGSAAQAATELADYHTAHNILLNPTIVQSCAEHFFARKLGTVPMLLPVSFQNHVNGSHVAHVSSPTLPDQYSLIIETARQNEGCALSLPQDIYITQL
ncbi:uncharacterized protein BJX67DRAFT_380268 [Aspergillus lucknowensis]|uniref:Uncharacterized protein n=1 Tax=Aspergillus lucknowensis TaxID=176173 RepID=A0ABR4LUA3_9EURO